jgi:hypothetical protein
VRPLTPNRKSESHIVTSSGKGMMNREREKSEQRESHGEFEL